MEVLLSASSDFCQQAVKLVHQSSKSQRDLATSIERLLENQFFKGEKVAVNISKKQQGVIVGLFRENSPSNQENRVAYNIETDKNIIEAIPGSKLTRLSPVEKSDVFQFITKFASKPSSSGPWIVRDEYLKKQQSKEKLHPFFTDMNGKRASTSNPATPIIKKPRTENGFSKQIDSDSSSDDDTPLVNVRKSAVGMAPHSAGAKKATKKAVTKKAPAKKDDKKSATQSKGSPKSKKSDKKSEKDEKSSKKKNKQLNMSGFLAQGSQEGESTSPKMTLEEKMEQRGKNINKQVLKAIVAVDLVGMNKILEAAARGFPVAYIDRMPNEFVRYCYQKALIKQEQKGKDATERARIRTEHKDLQVINELSYLHRKLLTGKCEDTWVANASELPELPMVEGDQVLFLKCIFLSAFMQSYRQLLDLPNIPTLFELMNSFNDGEDGYLSVTGPILTVVTDFIRKNQRTIPYLTGRMLSYVIKHISLKSVHMVARKILVEDYNPNTVPESDSDDEAEEMPSRASSPMEVENGEVPKNGKEKTVGDDEEGMEDEQQSDDDEEAQINKQSLEDDALCERFCHYKLYELKPLEQARILELLFERVESSGPVRNSMRNTDAEVKKAKDVIASKQEKVDKMNKELEELPPLIPEEDYAMYSRAQTIGIVKKNRERKGIEDVRDELQAELDELKASMEDMRSCSRFRASALGVDRFHRRYWFFSSSGLFVEQGAWTTETPDEKMPLSLPVKPKFTNSEVPDDQFTKFLHTLLNGGYPSSCAPIKWFHINTKELFDKLLDSLSAKGVRETALKDALIKSRSVIEASFTSD